MSPEAYNTQVQNLLAAMGLIQAQNRSDSEMSNLAKSNNISEEGAFPPTQPDSSLSAALNPFTPSTVQVPVLGSGGSNIGFNSDSMEVDDRGSSFVTENSTQQQFVNIVSASEMPSSTSMDVDGQKADSDAMDVDKPAQ